MRKSLSTLLALALSASISNAVEISLDFESQTAGSSTLPTGWSLQSTTGGTPFYKTSSASQGSDGSGGSTGLAGEVNSTSSPSNTEHPGAYLVSNTSLDLSKALTGSFDFRIVHESIYDDAGFILGAVADGITGGAGNEGELLYVRFTEGSSGQILQDGNGTVPSRLHAVTAILNDDTWYHATVSWTPTSGTTGDFSFTVTDFSSDVVTLSTTGFTFASAAAQIGFGTVNDTIRFDNVEFTEVIGDGPDPEITSITVDTDAGEATIGFSGKPNTVYTCTSSTDLAGFPTTEAAINGTSFTTGADTGEGSGVGTADVAVSGAKRFYRLEE